MQEPVGAVLAEDEPGADGLPEGRVHRLLRFPVNQGQGGDLGRHCPRQASCFSASWVAAGNRFSFPTMRSTTLSV